MAKVYKLNSKVLRLPDRLRGQRPPLPKEVFPDGCYRLRWREQVGGTFEGSLRVHRNANGVPDISGDLYVDDPAAVPYQGGDEIPVYARANYRYYLQFTQVLALQPPGCGVELEFTRVRRKPPESTSGRAVWEAAGVFRVSLRPVASDDSYTGEILESGARVASLHLVWVSRWLRAATIEIDHEQDCPVPVGNGDRIGWVTVGASVGWQFTRLRPQQLIPPTDGGGAWSDKHLHDAMQLWRDQDARLDQEWRYHLLCVKRMVSEDRGLMYDVDASDSSAVREGAAIAANWVFPETPEWGALGGKTFGSVPKAYFRTAVHEIGHAMGLFHDGCGRSFVMRPTESLAKEGAASNHLFPSNIDWSFDEADQLFLRHAPDPLVRPGGDLSPYSLNDGDRGEPKSPQHLKLSVRPLADDFPFGAPVRLEIHLTLHMESVEAVKVPDDLSLSGSHISGSVCRDGREARSFRPLLRRFDRHALGKLEPGGSKSASLTLLHGREGALFPEDGRYTIYVQLSWRDGGQSLRVSGETTVEITKPRDDEHRSAAKSVLNSPDTLLALALGGNHPKAGISAINEALGNPVLRPHYAWIEAKRRATLSGAGKSELSSAAALIDAHTVLSRDERERVRQKLVDNKKVSGKERRRLSLCLEQLDERSLPVR